MDLHARIQATTGGATFISRLTENRDTESQAHETLLVRGDSPLLRVRSHPYEDIQLPKALSYLREGDIVRVDRGAGHIRVLYRRNSSHNVLFFTERCNSRCLMCSQPPRSIDDGYLIDEILEAIPLMSQETPELCITGGEPTLLGHRLFEVIEAAKNYLPDTCLHMLSNGRLFRYMPLARRVAEVRHPDFMIGVPLYSDVASKHDFVVQAKGAFDETIRGIMNLARVGQRVEIRIVIHRQTFSRLAHTARFIARNLPFVDQIALMGLEMTGYTKANLEALWIDPIEYQTELGEAVAEFRKARLAVMIYNHQLCLLVKDLWPIARKSISDWKNTYMPECTPCLMKDQCGGFFASARLRYSKHITPFDEEAVV
jgi:His-Xaa-Ser system radical SAM maturase HxsC